jgi:hypothetical protein
MTARIIKLVSSNKIKIVALFALLFFNPATYIDMPYPDIDGFGYGFGYGFAIIRSKKLI